MANRREVNVNRPEHSWIPFYRELAEKLINDGWRERQAKLVGMLKEMGDDGMPVPKPLRELPVDYIDPFTFYASFNAKMKTSNRAEIIFELGRRFDIEVDLKSTVFYVPDVRPDNAIFFNWEKQPDYVKRIDRHWDTFKLVLNADPFSRNFNRREFVRLMNNSLDVTGVGMAKLTGAFYWINPFNFLESKPINAVLEEAGLRNIRDSDTYLEALNLMKRNSKESFLVINDDFYLQDGEELKPQKLWLVRGGSKRFAVGDFLAQNRVGIGFGLERVKLAGISTRRELEMRYKENRPDGSKGAVDQVTDFILNMEVGDYVIMPDRQTTHCGVIASRPYQREDGPLNLSRNVNWSLGEINSRNLPAMPPYVSVREMDDKVYDKFLLETGLNAEEVNTPASSELQMPEDSWVPFHLEVGTRLIEEEMWKPEMRDTFSNLVTQVMGSAGVFESNIGVSPWTPDPYSFYLAFNTASQPINRDAGYGRVQDLFSIVSDPPERGHYPQRHGVYYWGETPLENAGVEILWDFFRFVFNAHPLGVPNDDAEFVKKFDAAISDDVPGMASATLSRWLYWIDPTKYLLTRRLHPSNLGLAEHLGIVEPIEGGAAYLEALRAVTEFARSKGKTLLDINRGSTTREMLELDGPEHRNYDVRSMLREDVFLEESDIKRILRILRSKKNLILQGPPGVGKTFIAKRLAYALIGQRAKDQVTSVQFHQSYSYEDFVGGYRPAVENGNMFFEPKDGRFLEVCKSAKDRPNDDFVVLIDEINRGNLSRVFGELLMLIEADKRDEEYEVELQHRTDDDGKFFVPENVYIIGTMNLADRSLTGMNVAMRRRFGFVDLKPQFKKTVFTNWLARETDMPRELREWINTKLFDLNETIAKHPSLNENYAVGHSFFCPRERTPEEGWNEWYETIVEYEIRPLLREYWFDDPDTAQTEANKLLRNR